MTDAELVALYGIEGAKIAMDAIARSWQGIPLSERKPAENERVLWYDIEDRMWYGARFGKWMIEDKSTAHWLPQPPAPET